MNHKEKYWIISITLGIASAISILLTYLKKPEDINSAGSMFAYNLTFFFPLFILASLLGLLSLIYFIKFLKVRNIKIGKYRALKIGFPIFAILPIGFHLTIVLISIFSTFYSSKVPENHEPVFKSRQIKFDDSESMLYLHGALSGVHYSKRTIYLTDKPFSEINPETSILKYEGDNSLLLFYKTNKDTLSIFVPIGFSKSPPAFNGNFVVQQHEFNYEEANILRKQMSENRIKQFVWSRY